jgi:hypothetical protein
MRFNLQLRSRLDSKLLRQTFFVLLCLFAVPLVGCQRGPATSQVSGKVTLKDGTVPKGGVCLVRFQPAEGTTAEIRKGASGPIEPDGSLKMWTRKPGDGVYNGDYVVIISVLKGPMDPTPLIAEKYTRPDQTPFKITVDGDKTDLEYVVEPIGAPKS